MQGEEAGGRGKGQCAGDKWQGEGLWGQGAGGKQGHSRTLAVMKGSGSPCAGI